MYTTRVIVLRGRGNKGKTQTLNLVIQKLLNDFCAILVDGMPSSYAISPTLVKWFGDTKWFKKMWRGRLDKMVKKLQAEGYESTPYEDKVW